MKIFNITVPFTDMSRDVHNERLEKVKQEVRDKQAELQDLRLKEANRQAYMELRRERDALWVLNEEMKRKLEGTQTNAAHYLNTRFDKTMSLEEKNQRLEAQLRESQNDYRKLLERLKESKQELETEKGAFRTVVETWRSGKLELNPHMKSETVMDLARQAEQVADRAMQGCGLYDELFSCRLDEGADEVMSKLTVSEQPVFRALIGEEYTPYEERGPDYKTESQVLREIQNEQLGDMSESGYEDNERGGYDDGSDVADELEAGWKSNNPDLSPQGFLKREQERQANGASHPDYVQAEDRAVGGIYEDGRDFSEEEEEHELSETQQVKKQSNEQGRGLGMEL